MLSTVIAKKYIDDQTNTSRLQNSEKTFRNVFEATIMKSRIGEEIRSNFYLEGANHNSICRNEDLMYSISIYSSCSKSSNKLQAELSLLGSQTLMDLQNALYCVNGVCGGIMGGAKRGDCHQDHTYADSDGDSDGYFFIEGQFYASRVTDCVLRAIEWTRCHIGGGNPNYGVVISPIANVMLKDISLRLGVRYCYSHLGGGCEHFIYVSDVRGYFSSQVNILPRANIHLKRYTRKCSVCEIWSAKYLTYGDKLTDTNPSFFCQHCYFMLHYDSNGKLLYQDFQVFPYLHDM